MARKCFMCGKEIQDGILCEKCDKPRSKKSSPNLGAELSAAELAQLRGEAPAQPKEKAAAAPKAKEQPAPAAREKAPAPQHESSPASSGSYALDPFPKAPIV